MPKRGVAYSFSRGLYDATTGGHFRVNPTIATGDFKLSKDGGVFANLATLPTVTPAGSALVLFQLSATEMNATRLTILGVDQAGGEWAEFMEHLEPDLQTLADLPNALQIADAVLLRDWTVIGTAPPAYSVWNALRLLRNAWALVSGVPAILHVKDESGLSDAWSRPVTTNTAAEPITGAN